MTIYLSQFERDIVLDAHGRKCDKCGATDKRLELHHTDYTKKPDVVVCRKCHSYLHRQDGAPRMADVGDTVLLNIRDLPTWAADAIRARASKIGVTFSAMVRIILADAAMRYESEAAATPATVAAPAAQTTEG